MIRSPASRSKWSLAGGLVVGGSLLLAPPSLTSTLRLALRDAALPGLSVVRLVQEQGLALVARKAPASEEPRPEVLPDAELEELRTINRRLRLQLAQQTAAHEAASPQDRSPYLAEQGTPLFVPELIKVTVIAADVAHRERERLVNRGAAEGLAPQDLILPVSAVQALIDQGSDVHLQSDQPALWGRCVLGWIDQVGRHTSTVRPITDEKFRGRAQLVRQTTQGPRLGAEGVLAGHGQQLCRLTLVAATEAVSVGDEVFTSSQGELFPVAMYYGRVTSAELRPGEPYWDIMVTPGATLSDARTLQILRTGVNPQRLTSSEREVTHR